MLSTPKRAISALIEPISGEKRELLARRWQTLAPELQTDWQVAGRQIVHCSYTLGPSYCSFGCSHCYLPANANRTPLPSLEEMKRQIDANRRDQGPRGGLQITGGDVVDAYWRAGRPDELVEILRYANDSGLVPMLMTLRRLRRVHDSTLRGRRTPCDLVALVREGGLRKTAIHIDLTQAGRPGFPVRSLRSEGDLNPLRQQFVELIHDVRRRTGVQLTAAQTVTVTERNIDSLDEIVSWLLEDKRRLQAFHMLSFQTEAQVGRTRKIGEEVTAEATWETLCRAVGKELPRDGLIFGHPECSSWAMLLVDLDDHRVVNVLATDDRSRRFFKRLLETFGGVGSRGESNLEANLQRIGQLARHPGFVGELLSYLWYRIRSDRLGLRFFMQGLKGRVVPLNLVQHNFMGAEQIARGGSEVEERLAACSFRGAVELDGQWVSVPMCSMNAVERETLYEIEISKARETDNAADLIQNGRGNVNPARLDVRSGSEGPIGRSIYS